MALMQWTEDLAVGVEVIDRQHQELFRRIDHLVQAVKKKECKFMIGDVIQFLKEYVVEHFGDEERIMQEQKYPAYQAHKAQHEWFIGEFASMEEELRNEQSSYTRSVYTNQMVVDWITAHIKKLDRELASFLKERGGA
jgi:hemerythrin